MASQALVQIRALRERLEVFLGKLSARAEEIAREAAQAAPELRRIDPDEHRRSYHAFLAGVRGQLEGIRRRGSSVFEEHFEIFEESADEEVASVYDEAERRVEEWEEELERIAQAAFDEVARAEQPARAEEARRELDAALAEWREAASRFRCTQCGAPVPAPDFCTSARYLPCPACGTQLTFTPSSRMRAAGMHADTLADQAAEQQIRALEALEEQPAAWYGQIFTAHVAVLVARYGALLELLPPYAREQLPELLRQARSAAREDAQFEPAGTLEAESGYGYALGNLGRLLSILREDGRQAQASMLERVLHETARPGCGFAAHVLAGRCTEADWRRYCQWAGTLPRRRERPGATR